MENYRAVDTVIVGGGAAGLAAAATLGEAGQQVLLLEAQERLGGRVLSHTAPELRAPIELGAEFIHGRAAAKSAWLTNAGVVAVDVGQAHSFYRGRTWQPEDDSFQSLGRLFEGLDKEDISFETLLERSHAAVPDPRARDYARTLVEGLDAADPNDASSKALAREWGADTTVGGAQFRPLGGYVGLLSTLSASLRPNVEVLTGTCVRQLTWSKNSVHVVVERFGNTLGFEAKRAVVTLPVSLLKSHTVRFDPDIEKDDALSGLAMGPVVKLVLEFTTPFWEEVEGRALRGTTFFHGEQGAFPTFWTTLPLRLPYLTAWAGGPRAVALGGRTKDELVSLALRDLEHLFESVPRPKAAFFHDWQADPFARGAYSYVKVGGLESRAKLAEPLSDTLFFAGEATHAAGQDGTVYGALCSGERAAREVLEK